MKLSFDSTLLMILWLRSAVTCSRDERGVIFGRPGVGRNASLSWKPWVLTILNCSTGSSGVPRDAATDSMGGIRRRLGKPGSWLRQRLYRLTKLFSFALLRKLDPEFAFVPQRGLDRDDPRQISRLGAAP